MLHPTVFNTSEVCHQLGVNHAVFSPGSRNAPLTLSFARNKKIKKWIIPDERSAGFIALGIAQETNEPVVLCCTSGTALLNYAPAVAEAFYREIPLIVLSADRPPELIDQRDGQTIRQFEVLKNHVKKSYQLPLVNSTASSQSYTDQIIKGIQKSQHLPKGPVHLNIPFKEPFYSSDNQNNIYENISIETDTILPINDSLPLLPSKEKLLILIGQSSPDLGLTKALMKLEDKIPILISPLNNSGISGIQHSDLFIKNQKELTPDLLLTTRLSILSKKLKNFIRTNKPKAHWHFDPAGVEVDTFQTKPFLFKSSFVNFLKSTTINNFDEAYFNEWMSLDAKAKLKLSLTIDTSAFSELVATQKILTSLPKDCVLHLGNSMPVRYAEILGVRKDVKTYCNRGTSGIDGISSTALGSALVSDQLNVLITGDVSFLYDRNAFFHNYSPQNLGIIVMNNAGGGIFRLIDGPSNQPELEEYFETRHSRTAEHICLENGINYSTAKSREELAGQLETFYDADSWQLLEVFTDPNKNQEVYGNLRKGF